MSISSINRNMSVMESVLGKSVVPRRQRKLKKRGHRILCLDGGGVKVSWEVGSCGRQGAWSVGRWSRVGGRGQGQLGGGVVWEVGGGVKVS